jgi:hypothetical protein
VRRALVIALLSASTARADDAVPAVPATPVADDGTTRPGEPLAHGGLLTRHAHGEDEDERLLRLDAVFVTPLDRTLLATTQRDEALLDLGGATRSRLTTSTGGHDRRCARRHGEPSCRAQRRVRPARARRLACPLLQSEFRGRLHRAGASGFGVLGRPQQLGLLGSRNMLAQFAFGQLFTQNVCAS